MKGIDRPVRPISGRSLVLSVLSLLLVLGIDLPAAFAKPRSPIPPLPELAPRLHCSHFDESYRLGGVAMPHSLSLDYGELF